MLLLDLEKVNATVGPGEAVMNTLIGMGTVFVEYSYLFMGIFCTREKISSCHICCKFVLYIVFILHSGYSDQTEGLFPRSLIWRNFKWDRTRTGLFYRVFHRRNGSA